RYRVRPGPRAAVDALRRRRRHGRRSTRPAAGRAPGSARGDGHGPGGPLRRRPEPGRTRSANRLTRPDPDVARSPHGVRSGAVPRLAELRAGRQTGGVATEPLRLDARPRRRPPLPRLLVERPAP